MHLRGALRGALLVGAAAQMGALSCRDLTVPAAAAPKSLVVVAGDGQRVPAGFYVRTPVAVAARDAADHPLPGVELVFAEQRDSATFVDVARVATASDGIARFEWRLSAPTGQKTLRIRPADSGSSAEAMVSATALAPPGTGIFWTPTTATGGCCASAYRGASVEPPTFRVSTGGAPVAGVMVTFATGAKGGMVSPTRVTTGADGIARPALWVVGQDTGTYRVTALIDADSGASRAEAPGVTVFAGAPERITVVSGADQAIYPGQLVSAITVRIVDALGVGVPGVMVEWASPELAQTCSSSTDLNGLAAMPCGWIAGSTLGARMLRISAGTLQATVSVNVVEAPVSIAFTSPAPNTSGAAGTVLSDPLSVVVRYANGSPAPGVLVRFDGLVPGNSFAPSVLATTDARGMATARVTLPLLVGPDRLSASVLNIPAAFPFATIDVIVTGTVAFSGLSAGGAHSCGMMWSLPAALMFCWGRNASGQLGDGTLASPRLIPTRALLTGGSVGGMDTPAVGAEHTCVVVRFQIASRLGGYTASSYCVGNNASGQLGVAGGNRAIPQEVARDMDGVAAGATHSCARVGQQPYCWGDNSHGALGDGTLVSRSSIARVQYPTSLNVASVAAGDGFACALSTTGRVFCWGRNDGGQLGDGTQVDRLIPVEVAGGITFDARIPVTAGAGHACATKPDGTVYCWGRNESGQLGDGSMLPRSTPALVSGGIAFVAVSAGGAHSCGLDALGTGYCWGRNDAGQLGQGTASGPSSAPSPVVGDRLFRTMSAGQSHTCAVEKAAAYSAPAFCWGLNADGQLGDGTTISRASPVPVSDYRP